MIGRLNLPLALAATCILIGSGCKGSEQQASPTFLSNEEQIEKIKADPNLSQDAKDAAVMALEN